MSFINIILVIIIILICLFYFTDTKEHLIPQANTAVDTVVSTYDPNKIEGPNIQVTRKLNLGDKLSIDNNGNLSGANITANNMIADNYNATNQLNIGENDFQISDGSIKFKNKLDVGKYVTAYNDNTDKLLRFKSTEKSDADFAKSPYLSFDKTAKMTYSVPIDSVDRPFYYIDSSGNMINTLSMSINKNGDIKGYNLSTFTPKYNSPNICTEMCEHNPDCTWTTFYNGLCFIKGPDNAKASIVGVKNLYPNDLGKNTYKRYYSKYIDLPGTGVNYQVNKNMYDVEACESSCNNFPNASVYTYDMKTKECICSSLGTVNGADTYLKRFS